MNRKSLYWASQISCSPVTVPNQLQNASTFIMHSELHSQHLLLKGNLYSPTSCNLLLEYILSLHFLYTQKSMFKIQLHCNFFSFKWFFLSHIPYARKGIWITAILKNKIISSILLNTLHLTDTNTKSTCCLWWDYIGKMHIKMKNL